MSMVPEPIFERAPGRVARPEGPGRRRGRPRHSSPARGVFERSAEGCAAIAKVTSHAKSPAKRAQRIAYLAHGSDYVENELGQRLKVSDAAEASRDWENPTRAYHPTSGRAARYSTQLVVSFPAGTDPRVVEFVAREFAAHNFPERQYFWGVHAEEGKPPHAHFVIASASPAGALQTNPDELQRWREDMAARARGFGVKMQAHAHTFRLDAERWITGPTERMLVRTGTLARERAARLLGSMKRQPEAHREIEAKRQAEMLGDAKALMSTGEPALAQRGADMIARDVTKPRLVRHTPEQRAEVFRTAAQVQRVCPRPERLGQAVATLAQQHAAEWRASGAVEQVADDAGKKPAPGLEPASRPASEPAPVPTASADDSATTTQTPAARTRREQARRWLEALRRNPQALVAMNAPASETPRRNRWLGPTPHVYWTDDNQLALGFGTHKHARLHTMASEHPGYLRWVRSAAFPAHVHEVCDKALSLSPNALHEWAQREAERRTEIPGDARNPRRAPTSELAPRGPTETGLYASIGRWAKRPAQALLVQMRRDPEGMRARQAMRTEAHLRGMRQALTVCPANATPDDLRQLSDAASQFLAATRRPRLFSYTGLERWKLRQVAETAAERLPPSRLKAALSHAKDVWSGPDRQAFVSMERQRPRLADHRGVDKALGTVETLARQQARRLLEAVRMGPDAQRTREIQQTSTLLRQVREVADGGPDTSKSTQRATDHLLRGLRTPRFLPYTKDHRDEISALAGALHARLPVADDRRRAALRIAATHLSGDRHLTAHLPKRNTPLWRTPAAKPVAVMKAYLRMRARNVLATLRADPDSVRARQSATTQRTLGRVKERLGCNEPAKAAAILLHTLRRPRLVPHEHDDHRQLLNATRDIVDALPSKAHALRRHLRWQEAKLSERMPDSTLEHATIREADQARAQGKKPMRKAPPIPRASTFVKTYMRQQAARILHMMRVHPERLYAHMYARTHRLVARLNGQLIGEPGGVRYSQLRTRESTDREVKQVTTRFLRALNQPRLVPYSPPERYLLLGLAATLQDRIPASDHRLSKRLAAAAAELSSAQRHYNASRPPPRPARPGPRWNTDRDLTR